MGPKSSLFHGVSQIQQYHPYLVTSLHFSVWTWICSTPSSIYIYCILASLSELEDLYTSDPILFLLSSDISHFLKGITIGNPIILSEFHYTLGIYPHLHLFSQADMNLFQRSNGTGRHLSVWCKTICWKGALSLHVPDIWCFKIWSGSVFDFQIRQTATTTGLVLA